MGAGVRQVTSLDRDTSPANVVAVVQINTDAIDHFEADSDDAAFDIVYKGGTPGEPELSRRVSGSSLSMTQEMPSMSEVSQER